MEVEEKKASIFVVGARVALYVGRDNDAPYAVTKIAKVYKNGNVTIEHVQYSKQQFSPSTNTNWASATGSGYYARPHIKVVTPAIEAQFAKALLRRRWEAALYKLGRLRTENHDIAELDVLLIEELLSRMTDEKKESEVA